MKITAAMIVCSFTGLVACGCLAGPPIVEPGKEDGISRTAILAAHNRWRLEVGVGELAWSTSLEEKAGRWARELATAKGCRMEHSGPGENLFWASPQKRGMSIDGGNSWSWQYSLREVSAEEVVNSWASEKQWFIPESNTCAAPPDKTCGHYTQVIWQTTSEVGCGKAVCSDHSQVWVCNYDPPGNVIGNSPY